MLLHFHSHHSFSCKEGIIYSQALRYNMIIFEDHNLLKELNNLIRILLARAYPLHLITKNMIKALIYVHCNLQSQRTSPAETNLLHIITPFLDIGKSFTATIHKNWHTIAKVAALCAIWPSKAFCLLKIQQHYHAVHSAQTYGSSQYNI